VSGEYLKAQAAGERALAGMIARRIGTADGDLEPLLLAGVVVAAERAALLHWIRRGEPSGPLAGVVRTAVAMALGGMAAPGAAGGHGQMS
jgi:MftR C-terminal domain